jgi:phosphatidylserine/phosphatidylglycerophosphate/cardiolipin synthase-like enzyme
MHDFENASNGFNNHTRDKDVHVKGPAVTDMMRQYVRIWNHEQETPDDSMKTYLRLVEEKEAHEKSLGLRGREFYQKWLNQPNVSDIPGVCRVLVQGTKSAGQENIIAKAYIEIMKNVKHQMLLNTLSFNFKKNDQSEFSNTKIIKTLTEASKRNVTIDLVTNGVDAGFGEAGFQLRELAKKFNQKGQKLAARGVLQLEKTLAPFTGRSQRKNLMAALSDTTVDVWFYFNHIHSKQMEFDQIMTSTGSFNLDTYSHRNHESTLICLDKKLADESLREFAKDIVNSTPAF